MMAAGWQQHHRIPPFGDWNYPRDDGAGGDVDDDWPPVTPCFDFAFASAMRTAAAARPAAQQVCNTNERSSMPNARRVRIPAFGEWNHNGDGNGAWAPAVVMTPFSDLATPQKPHKTGRRRRRGGGFDAAAAKLATAAEPQGQGHMQTRRSKVADSGAFAAAATRSCFTVAKPVDDDLYGVPPDMLYGGGKPPSAARKDGWLRILRLLGCSCLSPSW